MTGKKTFFLIISSLLLAFSLAGAMVLVEKRQELGKEATETSDVSSDSWDWDWAASLCGASAECICSKLGRGFCAPGGKKECINDHQSQTCRSNKWDNTWGCWEDPKEDPICGTGPGSCPQDVTPYVQASGSLPGGYALCNNGGHNCLVLNLPEEYKGCSYLAEIYTDVPQDCERQQAHLRKREKIGDGGSVCFPNLPIENDCKTQIDIRYDSPGASAGNIITYKLDCAPGQPTPTPTTSPMPTPTPPPSYFCRCLILRMYDSNWKEITDFSSISVGDLVHFTVIGETNHPQGITSARFRINGGDWKPVTQKHDGQFYIQFEIPDYGDYSVEAQVFNTDLGWH